MTLAVVVDSRDSAIGLAAFARKNQQGSLILSSSDFMSEYHLIRAIEKINPRVIFFAWRGALVSILRSRAMSKLFRTTFPEVAIGLLIPDVIGLEPARINTEVELLKYVDFYLVTSVQLWDAYSQHVPDFPPLSLYRDLPDLELLSQVREESSCVINDFIWVGNSRWGSAQGKIDHKGLREVALPFLAQLGEKVKFEIIDSSVKRISHKQVLQRIKSSRILLQTSVSEGTGLPVLEAAGLGTVVVTTRVGIVNEFFLGPLAPLVVDRSQEGFAAGVTYASHHNRQLSKLMLERFDSYIAEVRKDRIPLLVPAKVKRESQLNSPYALLDHFKWLSRWIRQCLQNSLLANL